MTHDELIHAMSKFRSVSIGSDTHNRAGEPCEGDCLTCYTLSAHLDTLAAILDLHKPVDKTDCVACAGGMGEMADWPCPTVDEVESALRNMGAL